MLLKIKVHRTDENFVCEMSNKWSEETGLPMNIWIDESQWYLQGGHSKRLKFQLDTSDRLKKDELGEMDMEGNIWPKKLKTPNLREKDLTQLRNFVHNNRYALEYVADMDVRLYQIWNDIIKGGKRATDEQIAELNRKVDVMLAKNRRKK